MPITVLVNGAFGRMGQVTVKTITDHPRLKLVGQTGREYDLKKSIQDSCAEVVVDFTHPESVFTNIKTIIEAGAHPVIGTSGLTKEQIHILKDQCAGLARGAIIAPNFALGAVLMIKCAKEIAHYLPDVEIIEMHHDNKADSPSGTALYSAEQLADIYRTHQQDQSPIVNKPASHETIPGARGAYYQGIFIHALRLPGLVAHQQIIFGNTGETLTLRHDSTDRQSFMPGVCLACEKVVHLDQLVYGLEKIL